jgi:hypothetical protein
VEVKEMKIERQQKAIKRNPRKLSIVDSSETSSDLIEI